MFSLVKLALFSLIAFATLALAIPPSVGPPANDPRALIANANISATAVLAGLPSSPFYLPFYTLLDFSFTTPDQTKLTLSMQRLRAFLCSRRLL